MCLRLLSISATFGLLQLNRVMRTFSLFGSLSFVDESHVLRKLLLSDRMPYLVY